MGEIDHSTTRWRCSVYLGVLGRQRGLDSDMRYRCLMGEEEWEPTGAEGLEKHALGCHCKDSGEIAEGELAQLPPVPQVTAQEQKQGTERPR